MRIFFIFLLSMLFSNGQTLQVLSTKKWPNWYMYLSKTANHVRGWKGDPGMQGHWIFTKRNDGTYFITSKKWPNSYIYMTKLNSISSWEGDPGSAGYWILTKRNDGTYLLAPKKWPDWFVYITNTPTGNLKGYKGDPGTQGYWMFQFPKEQNHLSYTSKSNEMRIMWVTDDNIKSPSVIYGTSKDQLSSTSYGTSKTYKASDMCGLPATTPVVFYQHPGWFHDAVMTNLEPDTIYYYRVGDHSDFSLPTFSQDIQSFRTLPLSNRNYQPMSFFIFGDSGTGSAAQKTYQLIQKDLRESSTRDFKALLHIGDISYALGVGSKWKTYGYLIEPIASKIPYMVSIGNHEYGYSGSSSKDPSLVANEPKFNPKGANYGHDSFGECGVPMVNRFHMPDNGNGMFWYSFQTGLVHHIILSFEHNFMKGSRMYQWLVKDLKSVDRQQTPWVMVYAHRPLYNSEKYEADYKMSLLLRKHLEDLFYEYGVDAVFTGHYHSYERTCPVYKGHCLIQDDGKALAPTHIMIGSAGYELDNTGFYGMPWSKNGQLVHGYGHMHVMNRTHVQIEFVKNEEERITDSIWIVSDHKWNKKRLKANLVSLKEWSSEYLSLSSDKKIKKSGDKHKWIITANPYQKGTYLISSIDHYDHFLTMKNKKVEIVFSDPGKSGYWLMKKEDGHFYLSSSQNPSSYAYYDPTEEKVKVMNGNPGAKGHWKIEKIDL